jgi:hypothetical protein
MPCFPRLAALLAGSKANSMGVDSMAFRASASRETLRAGASENPGTGGMEVLPPVGLGKKLLNPNPVPLLEDQGGERGRVWRHLEGGAEGPRKSVPTPRGESFALLQQGGDGGAIQGRIGGERWAGWRLRACVGPLCFAPPWARLGPAPVQRPSPAVGSCHGAPGQR